MPHGRSSNHLVASGVLTAEELLHYRSAARKKRHNYMYQREIDEGLKRMVVLTLDEIEAHRKYDRVRMKARYQKTSEREKMLQRKRRKRARDHYKRNRGLRKQIRKLLDENRLLRIELKREDV